MNNILQTSLHDEKTFYNAFIRDLERCEKEIIIESPYITTNRMQLFYPVFERLLSKGIKIYVVTRIPEDQDNEVLKMQARLAVHNFERMGIQALLCRRNHHRKVAILDRTILWEGSLNILSQAYSREIMKRTKDKKTATQMFDFLNFGKYI